MCFKYNVLGWKLLRCFYLCFKYLRLFYKKKIYCLNNLNYLYDFCVYIATSDISSCVFKSADVATAQAHFLLLKNDSYQYAKKSKQYFACLNICFCKVYFLYPFLDKNSRTMYNANWICPEWVECNFGILWIWNITRAIVMYCKLNDFILTFLPSISYRPFNTCYGFSVTIQALLNLRLQWLSLTSLMSILKPWESWEC